MVAGAMVSKLDGSSAAARAPRVLGPRAFAAARLLWWLLLPLAIAGPLLSGWREHVFISQEVRGWAAAGVELYGFDPPTLNPFGPAARAAGIRYEETVTAVTGQPVATAEEARQAAADVPAGRPLAFTLTDDATGRSRQLSLPRDPGQLGAYEREVGVGYPVMLWLTYLIELAPGLIWLTAAVLLSRTRGREAAPTVLSVGAMGAVTASLWDSASELYGSGWGLPGAVVLPAAFIAMTWSLTAFPSGRLDRRWQIVGLALVAIAFAAWGAAWMLRSWLADVIVVCAAIGGLLLATAAVAGRWRRTPPGTQRQQMKWAAGGLAAGLLSLIAGGVTLLVTEDSGLSIGGENWSYLIGAGLCCLGLASVMAGLLVALLRFRLYDAEAVLGRSAALGALTLGAIALWAAAEALLKELLAGVVGSDNGPALSAIFATLAALMVAPARKRLDAWMRTRMQPGVAALTTDTPELLRDLKDVATPGEIARVVVGQVASAVRSERALMLAGGGRTIEATVGLSDEDAARWTEAHGASSPGWTGAPEADPRFPLAVPLPSLAGAPPDRWLLLGPRPDGSLPSPDDRKAVRALATPLARALHAAAHREARDARLSGEIEALRARLEAVASRTA